MWHLFVVLAEKVFAEIVLEVPPDGVDMVSMVLGVVIFHQESRSLDAVIVAVTWFKAARPGEINW